MFFFFFLACLLPVSVDCLFSITPSVFSSVYYLHRIVVFCLFSFEYAYIQLDKSFFLLFLKKIMKRL